MIAARRGKIRGMTNTPDDSERAQHVTDVAQRYSNAFLACRDYGHSWRTLNAAWLAGGGVERRLRCTSCKCERVQILDAQGYIVASHYEYPGGYRIDGVGSLTANDRAVLRRTHVVRELGN